MKSEKVKSNKTLVDNFEKTYAALHPEAAVLAKELLQRKCEFSDDWNVVVGLDADLLNGVVMAREEINDILFANNYLVGYNSKKFKDFIIYNPIFLKQAHPDELNRTIPRFLAADGETYEVTTPSVAGYF